MLTLPHRLAGRAAPRLLRGCCGYHLDGRARASKLFLHTAPSAQRASYPRSSFPLPGIQVIGPGGGGGGGSGRRGGDRDGSSSSFKQRVQDLPPVVWVVVGGGGVYYIYHLERTETGRLRFMDVTEASEREMGEQAAQEILQQYSGKLLPESHPTSRYVRRVADRILAASGLDSESGAGDVGVLEDVSGAWKSLDRKKGVQWKVRVIKDDGTKNAFVLPDGSIFVFTGILPICANEDGLAAVLGHEVAHQVARHAGERMSSQKINMALSLLASTLGIDPNLTSPAIGLLLTLPNSRAAETEADHIGLKLASKACYDPAEAVNLWTRMQQSEQGGGGGGDAGANIDFLSTHPANSKRIEQIRGWLPEVQAIRDDSCGPTRQAAQSFQSSYTSFFR